LANLLDLADSLPDQPPWSRPSVLAVHSPHAWRPPWCVGRAGVLSGVALPAIPSVASPIADADLPSKSGQIRKFPFRAHRYLVILIDELPMGFAETTGAKWQQGCRRLAFTHRIPKIELQKITLFRERLNHAFVIN